MTDANIHDVHLDLADPRESFLALCMLGPRFIGEPKFLPDIVSLREADVRLEFVD